MIDGEEKLVKDAIRGEASAFGSLYDRYQPRIYRFVYLKVSHREEAEDLTHQIFLSAWQNMASFSPREGVPFSAWLYGIARNKIIDHYRVRRQAISLEDANQETFQIAPASDRNAELALMTTRIRSALKTMSADFREVIILRFVEEMSIKETSAIMNKSNGAIKILQHRAIKALRESLAKQEQKNIKEKTNERFA